MVWPDNGQIVDRKEHSRKETGLRFSHRVHNATLQQVLLQQGKSFFPFTSKISYTIHDTKDECQNARLLYWTRRHNKHISRVTPKRVIYDIFAINDTHNVVFTLPIHIIKTNHGWFASSAPLLFVNPKNGRSLYFRF